MKRFVLVAFVAGLFGAMGSFLLAEDHNADTGEGDSQGVDSPWDHETVNILNGNLHLSIPLYSIRASQDFGFSVALHYNSKVWDSADASFPGSPSSRSLVAKTVFGLGWNLHFGRIYSLTYTSGSNTEIVYFFEGPDGSRHRLYAISTDAASCSATPYWYAYDGSGIRAQFSGSGSPNPLGFWTAWMPDGTKYELAHFVEENPTTSNTPEQVNYKGWYTTYIASAVQNASGPMHHVGLYYAPASETARRYCPLSIYDERGRAVTFDCQASTADGTVVDGGVVRSITVPAPPSESGATRTLTYQFDYTSEEISDPFSCPDSAPCVAKTGVLLLGSITAVGVTPTHQFQFGYHLGAQDPVFPPVPGPTFGELTTTVLPGGAKRLYSYGTYNVWRKDYPIIYGSSAAPQFAYFPVRSVVSRQIQVDGTTWRWDYQRLNDAACAAATPLNCANHPVTCQITGPYRPEDTILGSSTVYTYNVTKASALTPGGGDGSLQRVEVYAGPPDAARKLRTRSFQYAYDAPSVEGCDLANFSEGHYGDNLRLTDATISFDDDGKPIHDVRRVRNVDWRSTSPNSGHFMERWEYHADGTTLYRKSVNGPPPVSPPPASPFPILAFWSRTIKVESGGTDTVVAEIDFTSDSYGRILSSRRLYAPATSPQNQTSDDLLTNYQYGDALDGNLSRVDSLIPAQPGTFTELLTWQQGGYLSRRQLSGNAWYAFDAVRDASTGLPTQIFRPWRTGVQVNYDLLGRVVSVQSLSGASASGDPSVALTYSTGQVTTTTGDSASPQSQIQAQTLFDGLGRVREERILKYDDLGADQWVARTYQRNALGNVSRVSEWAPLGTPIVPATSLERFGTYAGGIEAYDPLFQVRQLVLPDGNAATYSYQGLVSTITLAGIQGGTAGSPALITSVTTRTSDIFGRLIQTRTCDASGCAANQPLIEQTYDVLDHSLKTTTNGHQSREKSYDPLGRITLLSEPERGKIWYGGSHTAADVVTPDGYNALGELVIYQDATGAATTPTPYHYLLTYDAAGRPTKTEKEMDPAGSGSKTTISERLYDLSDHGNAAFSYLGRLGQVVGYDDLGRVVEQNDFYYQGDFGRFNQQKMVFGQWDGTPGISGTDAAYSLYYGYDALGQVATLTYPTTGGPGSTSGSTNLSLSRLHGIIRSLDSNRGTPLVTNALYNDALGLKEWDTPSGLRTQIVPDDPIRSRVREVKVSTAAGAILWTTGAYSYDGAGHIIATGGDSFWYDALGRLTEGDVLGPTPGTFHNQAFAYDAFGNVLSRADSVPAGGSTSPTTTLTTYNYDRDEGGIPTTNRLRGTGGIRNWPYRADGALTGDSMFNYVYDNAGRLSQIAMQATGEEVGKYSYDGLGLRTLRTEDHGKEVFSFRDPDGNVLSQFSRPAGTALPPQWDRDFVYFGGTRVSMIEKPTPPAVAWKLTQSVNSGSGAGIRLEWYPSTATDTYGYLVYRKNPGPSTFTPLYAVGTPTISTTGTIYLDPAIGLTAGSTYTYKVVAVDSAGNQGPDSAERIITFQDSNPPYPPTDLQATEGNGNVSLSWTAPTGVPDLAGYYIYRKTGAGSYGSPLNSLPITDTYYYDLNVVNGTTYRYVVKSVDTANLQSASASNEVTATPQAAGGGGGGGGGVNPKPRGALEDLQPCKEEKTNAIAQGEAMAPYELIGQAASVRILFLHSDHLGSLRLVTDMVGQVVSNHKYLPFGEEVQPMHTLDPFKYAGYERDSESGMDYVRARFYSPARARWLTPDPLGGGFKYAASSPVQLRDPSGLCVVLVCARSQDENRPTCGYQFCDDMDEPSPSSDPGGFPPLPPPVPSISPAPNPPPPQPPPKPKCTYTDLNVTGVPGVLSGIVLALGGPEALPLAGVLYPFQATGGVQTRESDGEVFAYLGFSYGLDYPNAQFLFPTVSISEADSGQPTTGFFVASTETLAGRTWQQGISYGGNGPSSFSENGFASSLGGVGVSAAYAFDTGIVRQISVDCEP